jgi:hypothetical protein
MNISMKNIRKLMGWCPNEKALETHHSLHPEYFGSDIHSGGKDAGNYPVLPSGWWSKRHNRVLVYSGQTLFSIFMIGFQVIKIRDEAFVWGLIIGTVFNIILCFSDWQQLDQIEKMENSSKKIHVKLKSKFPELRFINSMLSFIVLYILFSRFNWGFTFTFVPAFCLAALLYCLKKTYSIPLMLLLGVSLLSGWKFTLALISGFCLTAFLLYLAAIYWEKKNKKIVLIYGRNMPEICIVNEGTE